MSRRSEQAAGREGVLASLENHLVAALRGGGRIVGIEAAPGTGRSALALEFLRGCRERGLAVSGVECLAHGEPAAFIPARSLLRAILGLSERDDADVARGRVESQLAALDPGIESELPLLHDFLGLEDLADPAEERTGGDLREALHALVARVVRASASGVAQVMLVDDVDHLDPASAGLIAAIAGAVDGSRALLVTTAAPGHRAPWMDKPCFHSLALEGDDTRTTRTAPISDLADDERVVLGIAAAIGMHFSVPMLERCCGLDHERVAAALYALQNTGLVRPRARSPVASFAISGPGVRNAALARLGGEERAAAHRRVALAMEELDFERLDERAPLLAHHWEGAGENAAAARWHRHAAKCIAAFAPEVAASHRSRAEALG